MWLAIILKETKFCKLMKINSASVDIFSLLIERTLYNDNNNNSNKYSKNKSVVINISPVQRQKTVLVLSN